MNFIKKIGILFFAFVAVTCLGVAAACTEGVGGEDTRVSVKLVSELSEETIIKAEPGEELPVVSVEDKDFIGYWTDSAYSVRYEGTTVPESDITLYYKLASQYYTVIIDYGENGSFTFGELCRGEDEELPELAPDGSVLKGFAVEKGGEVVYPAGEPVRNLAEKDGTVTLYAVCEREDAEDYIIENGVVVAYIGSETELTLPSGATSVAAGAFSENLNSADITSLTVPSSYKKVERGAFEGLVNLQSLTVPFIGESRTKNRFLAYMFGAEKYTDNYYSFSLYTDGTNFYEGNADFGNLLIPSALRTVSITETVRDFAEGAFYGAYSLENVILEYPDKLMSIGNSAFENCYSFGYDTALGVAVNPVWLSYVSKIGDRAFKSYTGDTETDVTSVDINGVTASLVTNESPLNVLSYIPELTNVETIGNEAFYYCAMLEKVVFGEKLKAIGDNAFIFAFSLSNIRFPDSLERIGKFAFSATSATVIEFGSGIREIGSMAFAECSSLKEIIFRGGNVPTLSGGQCFSNTVEESVTGNWNVVFDDDFRISVPEDAIGKFVSAPDWTEYLIYIDGAINGAEETYWSADGSSWDAKLSFSAGGAVFVSDPNKKFASAIDEEGSFSQTCGTLYTMLYRVVDGEEYASGCGSHARALYKNEYIVCMWNPSLTDSSGKVSEFFFVVTKLPFSAEGGRVILPVLQSCEDAGKVYGDETANGSFVISYNNYGLALLMQVSEGELKAVADPEETYYSHISRDASGVSYCVTYYNSDFEIISQRTFVCNVNEGYDSPLTEKTAENAALLTAGENGGNVLFLKGDGTAYVKYNNSSVREYIAAANASGTAAYGEEGYAVTLTDFKGTDGASADLSGSAAFYGFDGKNYTRVDIKIGDFSYMIINMQSGQEWEVFTYNQLEEAPEVIIPVSSPYGDAWRYKKLSNPEVNGTLKIYSSQSGFSYFREFDAEGNITSCGKAEISGEKVKLISSSGAGERTARMVGENISLDGKTFTRYNSDEDMTLVLFEDSIIAKKYYYTIKTDGYGNMYILDESYSGYKFAYLGTYTALEDESLGSLGYGIFVFTGCQVSTSTGKPVSGAEEETLWIMYDLSSVNARTSEQDSPWYGYLSGIYTPQEDVVITVNDAFGFRLYEITVDPFGGTSFVAYSYEVDREGNVTYKVADGGEVKSFIPVYGDDDSIALFVAINAEGHALFSLRPDEEGNFRIVKDGGQVVTYPTAALIPDVSALEKLPEGGASFGTIS